MRPFQPSFLRPHVLVSVVARTWFIAFAVIVLVCAWIVGIHNPIILAIIFFCAHVWIYCAYTLGYSHLYYNWGSGDSWEKKILANHGEFFNVMLSGNSALSISIVKTLPYVLR
jgi:hypothetical protein